ncbi:GNAT family N-acetyltransferase [uncultured Pontibacter sp.]|uniref:GNAT family N-acetyltransferase n=1 Tax=uncultured Pontibacter sp. TaxID=453356 RepID=UPI00262B6925|nr:GNAT family N-acetyltransferase [uncultured Pontibacter sp.]
MITSVAASDFEELVQVWEASVRATHHFLPEEDILYFKPLILNEYLHAVNLACIRDKSNTILGFVGVADGKVEMLFVHPGSRGTGVGKKLLTYAVIQLDATKVDVNEQNLQAMGFYEHMGFRTTGRSELDALGKPYPILHMELRKQ